ncbi:MAG: hypothetical protein ACREXJ_08360 [Gammaproteobacteria bacterium]
MSEITDGNGNLTRIERDTEGAPAAVLSSDGQRTSLTLDTRGYLASVQNPAGDTFRMEYTAEGLVTRFADPKGQASTFEYDALGRLTQDVNAGGGGWTVMATDHARGYTTHMTTAEGRTTGFSVEHLATGDRRQVNTSPGGAVRARLFNTGRYEEITTGPGGTLTTVLEGPDPRFGMLAPFPASVTVKLPSGLTSTTTTARTATLAHPNDRLSLTGLTETTTRNGKPYESQFDATAVTFTATSPLGRSVTTTVNPRGRPQKLVVPGLAEVVLTYDTRGRLLGTTQGEGTEARSMSLNYFGSGPSQGYLESRTDALGRTVEYDYDLAGRVTRKTLPDGRAVRYGYDPNGNLTSLFPPGQPAHLFDYTVLDQEKDYTPPAVDTFDPATHYTYNRDKQLELITRPDGKVLDFVYDGAGRPQSLTAPHGETAYTYDGAGRLQSLTAPGGIVLTYGYDGALVTSEAHAGPVTGALSRRYDADFRVHSLSVNGASIAFGYDNDSLLTSAGSLALTRNLEPP